MIGKKLTDLSGADENRDFTVDELSYDTRLWDTYRK
jgi:hypothetical protein